MTIVLCMAADRQTDKYV